MEKVVVVTGASAGIGAAVAGELGKRGARVVLAARREKELRAAAAQAGPNALAVVADVTRREDVERIFAETVAKFGHVDVWVNNVGRGITRPASEMTDEDLDSMMTSNVKAAWYGVQAVLPHFRERGTGHLINVSSMLGRIPYVHLRSAYNAAKHALTALTGGLRLELREKYPGIHVSSVFCGVVYTDFGLNALHGGVDSRKIAGGQTAEEVAAQIADLIETPRADLYTRPDYREQVATYFSAEDVAVLEALPPFVRP